MKSSPFGRCRAIECALMLCWIAGSAAGDEPKPSTPAKVEESKTEDKLKSRRLEYMKSSVKEYEFLVGPDFESKLALIPEPLLRFTNPVSGLQDGGFIVWKSDSGRPMVGAQVFLTSEDLWIHEFQSLAPVLLRVVRNGENVWEPGRAGAEVKLVPNAPVPAATAVQRLTQMRQISRRFSVSDEFEGREQSDELRLLSNPLMRFGDPEAETLDGGLFTYAHGTDPELLIVLEAKKVDDGYRWHYALAPMTGYALKAALDEMPVWEVPWRKPPFDPKEPFYIFVHSREPSLKGLIDAFRK